MKLLAIDPGTNALGLALFQDGKLLDAVTITAPKGERLQRISYILDAFAMYLYFRKPTAIVCEDPFLRGAGNGTMERLKGALEATSELILSWNFGEYKLADNWHYLGPTTIKRHLGHGDLSKKQMAEVALTLTKDQMERDILEGCITREDWDATDAICIGLTFLGRNAIGV